METQRSILVVDDDAVELASHPGILATAPSGVLARGLAIVWGCAKRKRRGGRSHHHAERGASAPRLASRGAAGVQLDRRRRVDRRGRRGDRGDPLERGRRRGVEVANGHRRPGGRDGVARGPRVARRHAGDRDGGGVRARADHRGGAHRQARSGGSGAASSTRRRQVPLRLRHARRARPRCGRGDVVEPAGSGGRRGAQRRRIRHRGCRSCGHRGPSVRGRRPSSSWAWRGGSSCC